MSSLNRYRVSIVSSAYSIPKASSYQSCPIYVQYSVVYVYEYFQYFFKVIYPILCDMGSHSIIELRAEVRIIHFFRFSLTTFVGWLLASFLPNSVKKNPM